MKMTDTNQIKKFLKTLSLGLLQNNSNQIYYPYKELYKVGQSTLPIIEKQILSFNLNKINSASELNLFTGLYNLIHDIDEDYANKLKSKILCSECTKTIKVRLNSINSFSKDQFIIYKINEITIFQSKKIKKPNRIKKILNNWLLSVPINDLKNIERIYIDFRKSEDYLGNYMPILCNILIFWYKRLEYFFLLSFIFLYRIEFTLYHEIGHHCKKHTFGQDPIQEKEANLYALENFLKNHKFVNLIFHLIKKIVKIFRKERITNA